LLASARSATPGATTLPIPFSSAARGTLRDTGGADGGGATVTIDAVLPGARDAQLQVVIAGSPLAGGGVRMDTGTVHLGVAGAPDLYQGAITSLNGTSIAATARTRDGSQIALAMQFTVDGANVVGGTVSAEPGGSGGN
jgi:hypothetical protein